jgi:hypothetical protein
MLNATVRMSAQIAGGWKICESSILTNVGARSEVAAKMGIAERSDLDVPSSGRKKQR